MKAILEYLITMLPFILFVLPISIALRALYLKRHLPKYINGWHEAMLILFILFLSALAAHTLLPRLTLEGGAVRLEYDGLGGINLKPFHFVEEIYIEAVRHGNTEYFIINFLGNIGMFVPLGLMPKLLWRVRSRWVLLWGFAASLMIEVAQLCLPRSTDIDDLILNTLGVLLGLGIYPMLKKTADRFKIH